MRTLADMTPQERANTVGMWATVDTERYIAVIVRTYAAEDVQYAQMLAPELNDYYTASLESITPRPDLPRAWTMEGQPPEADWQYVEYRPGVNPGFYTLEETTEKGPEMAEETTIACRWVGEWEQA